MTVPPGPRCGHGAGPGDTGVQCTCDADVLDTDGLLWCKGHAIDLLRLGDPVAVRIHITDAYQKAFDAEAVPSGKYSRYAFSPMLTGRGRHHRGG